MLKPDARDAQHLERIVDAVVVRLARLGQPYPARAYIRDALERARRFLPVWVDPSFVADLVEVGWEIREEIERER